MVNKNLYFLFHQGTGDNFTMYAAVLYFSGIYEKVFIFCLYRNSETIQQLYEKYNNIIILVMDKNYNNSCIPENFLQKFLENDSNYDVIKCGFMDPNYNLYGEVFYKNFYKPAKLEYKIRYEYNDINRKIDEEDKFYQTLIKKYGEKYIFLHDHRSYNYKHYDTRKNVNVDSELPIFHPNYNYYNDYPDHKFYNLWDQSFCVNNLFKYCKIIEKSTEIHISDSSFCCLCPYLDLSLVQKKYVYTYIKIIDYHSSFEKWNIIH